MNRLRAQNGLTLIEVLVAMVVLGTAIASTVSLLAIQSANIHALDEQILARIVAENAMVEAVLSDAVGNQADGGGTVELDGHVFSWSVDRTASPYEGVEIVRVRVADTVNEDRTLATLSTLRVQ